MIDITDKNYKPDIEEIKELIHNPLFDKLIDDLDSEFKALYSIEYSGDKILLGWNVKFYKSGRTLCRLYPVDGYFKALVVVGRKEKEQVEAILPQMCKEMVTVYNGTQEGMGQRWLLLELGSSGKLIDDMMKIVRIRRKSK